MNRIGNRTVDKFEPNYTGPYCIKKVHADRVSYDLCDLEDPDQIIRAHHVQLKPWKDPPNYIVEYMARSPIFVSVSDEGGVDEPESGYRPSSLIVPIGHLSASSDSVSSSSSDSSDSSGPGSSSRRSRVRFQLDSVGVSDQDVSESSGFSGFSPRSILKPSRVTATGDDVRGIPIETAASPPAGDGLVASSFVEGVAPAVMPSWELSPIAKEPVIPVCSPGSSVVVDALAPVSSPSVSFQSSPIPSVSSSLRVDPPLSEPRSFDLSVLDDVRLLFEGASAELEGFFNFLSRTACDVQTLIGEDGPADFSGFAVSTPAEENRLVLRRRMAALRGEVEEMRVRFAQGRKQHRERCLELRRRISLGPGDVSHSFPDGLALPSPPHTRSRGRAQDLPHVQPRVLERRVVLGLVIGGMTGVVVNTVVNVHNL